LSPLKAYQEQALKIHLLRERTEYRQWLARALGLLLDRCEFRRCPAPDNASLQEGIVSPIFARNATPKKDRLSLSSRMLTYSARDADILEDIVGYYNQVGKIWGH